MTLFNRHIAGKRSGIDFIMETTAALVKASRFANIESPVRNVPVHSTRVDRLIAKLSDTYLARCFEIFPLRKGRS